jgi:hypothetical protein
VSVLPHSQGNTRLPAVPPWLARMVPSSTNTIITAANTTIASCSRIERLISALSDRSRDPARWPVACYSSRGVTAA